jgi:hypothetical protein
LVTAHNVKLLSGQKAALAMKLAVVAYCPGGCPAGMLTINVHVSKVKSVLMGDDAITSPELNVNLFCTP